MKKYRMNLLEKIRSDIQRNQCYSLMEDTGKAFFGICEGGYLNCISCKYYIHGGHQ